MKIRKAKKEDLKEIVEIFMEESAKKPYCTKFTRAFALKYISDALKGDLYVACVGDVVAGFIYSYVSKSDKEKVFLDEFWVRPEYQGIGAGRALLEFVEKMYKKRGVRQMRLATNKKAEAVEFYKKLNYRESEEIFFLDKKL